jgi:deoxycytidylate deaminase
MIHITVKEQRMAMGEAWSQANNSECLKKKVGAVLYDTEKMVIVGRGYGGPKEACERCVRKEYEWQQDGCWSVHSEMRAIFDAMNELCYGPGNLQEVGGKMVMFVTHGPCDQCLKLMNYFNIPLAIYDVEYHNDYSKWDGKIRVCPIGDEDGFDI